MLLGIVDESQVGWTAVLIALGTSILALAKTMIDGYNNRCDKRQAAAERQATDERALAVQKVLIAKEEQERRDKMLLDSTIVDIKQKMAECDEKHAECEDARKADAARFDAKFKQHQVEARERAVAVQELQQAVGLPVTVVVPPVPPSSGSHLHQPLRIVEESEK